MIILVGFVAEILQILQQFSYQRNCWDYFDIYRYYFSFFKEFFYIFFSRVFASRVCLNRICNSHESVERTHFSYTISTSNLHWTIFASFSLGSSWVSRRSQSTYYCHPSLFSFFLYFYVCFRLGACQTMQKCSINVYNKYICKYIWFTSISK